MRACTAEIMRAITALVEELRGEKAPRPFDLHYDGDPGKGRIGVRRPDPLPEPHPDELGDTEKACESTGESQKEAGQ